MTLIILRLSLIALLNSVWILLSVAAVKQWRPSKGGVYALYQLDIKNIFFHEDLQEELYML